MAKIISKKLNKSLGKVRSTSKNKFNGQYSQTGSTIRTKENANSKDKILLRNNQNGIDKYTKYGYKTMNSDSKMELKTINTNINLDAFNTLNNENIVYESYERLFIIITETIIMEIISELIK